MVLAEDLRQAVLQAALQGKLTAQLETDSDVDELLVSIRKKREGLIAQKEIKKEKPIPDIEEEEIPFDIPDNWRWVRWGNLAYSIQYGYNAPAQKSGKIKMVRISDIQDNSVNWNSVPYCDIEDEEIETYLLKENDILFARTGGTVGKSFLVNNILENAIYAGYLIRTRYDNRLAPKYLKFFMESQLYWVQLQNGKTQGCQPNCNGQTLSKMIIPLPPVEEQQRIVDKINEIMPKIDEYEKIEKELEVLKKEFPTDMKDALLQAAMQGKLTEQLESDSSVDELLEVIKKEKKELIAQKEIKKEKPVPNIEEEEIPFDIPKNWRWVRLIDLFQICNGDRGKNYPSKNTLSKEGIPFISALNLNNNTVVKDDNLLCVSNEQYDKLSNGKLKKGDAIVCIRGSLGKHARYPFEKGAIASSLVILRQYVNQFDLMNFLFTYLDAPIFDNEIKKYDNGTAQPNLAAESLKKFLIPLPPIEEQQRIVERLDALLPLCEDLKE